MREGTQKSLVALVQERQGLGTWSSLWHNRNSPHRSVGAVSQQNGTYVPFGRT